MRSQGFFNLLTSLLLCSAVQAQPESAEPFDEHAIDDVWHKAKLRGVSFRAIGQEPGWLLEITDGKEVLLVTDYGQNRTSYAYVTPQVYQQARRTMFVLDDGNVVVEIYGRACQDVMSGERFAVSVTITMQQGTLQGCGRALY